MIKIAIGTTSSYKANAIKKALHELDFEFESKSVQVESNVSEQPKEANETKQGSINRAKNALAAAPESDFAIGVEFGYEPINDTYSMIC